VTWLIVEDDPEIRNLVAVMMQVWGETPIALPDGNAAWRWLDSIVDGTFKGELPELALMDIRMPGHTGDQISARMRETERIKHIPIILMTAFTLTESEVQSMVDRAGIDRVIKKPLPDMDEFRATLYRVRDEKRKSQSAPKAAAPPAAPVPTAPRAPVVPPPVPPAPAPSAPKVPPVATSPARPVTAILNPRPESAAPAKPTDQPKPPSPASGSVKK
jgi:DNA-binding response OmpR family regulator